MHNVAVNFLHLLGAAVWIGGSVFVQLVLRPSLSAIEPSEAGKLFGVVGKKFSLVSWISLTVLVVTGILKTPQGMFLDLSAGMGRVLFVKHLLILVVIVLGAMLAHVVLPRVRAAMPAPGQPPSETYRSLQKRLTALTMTNTILGLLILVCASMLW